VAGDRASGKLQSRFSAFAPLKWAKTLKRDWNAGETGSTVVVVVARGFDNHYQ
jgi:hypothetical protein